MVVVVVGGEGGGILVIAPQLVRRLLLVEKKRVVSDIFAVSTSYGLFYFSYVHSSSFLIPLYYAAIDFSSY